MGVSSVGPTDANQRAARSASVVDRRRSNRSVPSRSSEGGAFAWHGQCRMCLTQEKSLRLPPPFCERDVVSEAFELLDEAFGLALGVAVGEVVAAGLAVGLAGGEHVPDRAEHGVLDCAE